MLVPELLDVLVGANRAVEHEGEERRLRVEQAHVAEVFAGEEVKPERTDLELLALDVELHLVRGGIENRAFEELLRALDQVGLVAVVVLDVEVAEEVDARERVQRLVLERQRRLRIDEVHAGRERRVHVLEQDDVVDLRE